MNKVTTAERTWRLDGKEKVIHEIATITNIEFDFDRGTVQTKIKKRGKMITIHIPENGRVAKFDVDPAEYDVDIWQIDEEVAKTSQALREMIAVTGATHQGCIKFKDGKKGSIEELNKIIEIIDQGDSVAFYSIIKD